MQLIQGNYIDLIIILTFIYFIFGAFKYNIWHILSDFISFFGSLILSFRFYKPVSEFLKLNFSLTSSISNALGFLFSAIIIESILSYLTAHLVDKIPEKVKNHKISKFFSIIPSVGEALIKAQP